MPRKKRAEKRTVDDLSDDTGSPPPPPDYPTPGKIRIEKFNEDRPLNTPITKAFIVLLKASIFRNFGVRLKDEHCQTVADMLKAYDGNIVSTKSEEMKQVVYDVIEGSIDDMQGEKDSQRAQGGAASQGAQRDGLAALLADAKSREMNGESEEEMCSTDAPSEDVDEDLRIRGRRKVSYGTEARDLTAEETAKCDLLLDTVVPAVLKRLEGNLYTLPRKLVVEAFFCKKRVDKEQLQREIEELQRESGNTADKEAKAQQLKLWLDESVETIDVHKEAQELMDISNHGQSLIDMRVNAQATFTHFSNSMRSARQNNVRGLHLTGHGTSRCGFYWLKRGASATQYEEIPVEKITGLVKIESVGGSDKGTIEFAMLNACETEEMGKKLRAVGVRHVVCWRSEVDDNTAREFALEFYRSIDQQDRAQATDFKRAFRQAVARMGIGGGSARAAMKHLARGAVDYVCLLSEDGDEFPSTGRIRGLSEEEECDTRNMRPPQHKEDWSALAGQQELLALEQLGFDVKDVRDRSGLDDRGFIKHDVLRQWGVCNYSCMWGRDGRVVQEAEAVILVAKPHWAAKVQHAITFLGKALEHRKEDLKKNEQKR